MFARLTLFSFLTSVGLIGAALNQTSADSSAWGMGGHRFHGVERGLASMRFPQHRATSDTGTILDRYPDYLQFAIEAGRVSNPALAKQLEKRFIALKNADERFAARFLKGLRFEMHQKLELVGYPADRITASNPAIRKWVNRYLATWVRELDEYQFRAYASAIAKRK